MRAETRWRGTVKRLYVTAFVQPISGETAWYVSNGISKPFFAALLALVAREAGVLFTRTSI